MDKNVTKFEFPEEKIPTVICRKYAVTTVVLQLHLFLHIRSVGKCSTFEGIHDMQQTTKLLHVQNKRKL